MYPVSVSYFNSPECEVLSIYIEDLTSKSASLLFTPINARELLKISIMFHISPMEVIICFLFNIFLRKIWYFVQILVLYMILSTDLFSIESPITNSFIFFNITNKQISTKLYQNNSILLSVSGTKDPNK